MDWQPGLLPYEKEIETKKVLKALPRAHRALAELKGIVQIIPNQNILLNTLALQEAKDSSGVENIITTHDELYKAELDLKKIRSVAAKEVQNYAAALKRGFDLVKEIGLLTNRHILTIQSILEQNSAGFRKALGTTLKNQQTGEVIYQPPQDHKIIVSLMENLELFINDNEMADYDPLVKMAIIHFQFESIHPFYDGNGRTGRIINILYLVLQELLELPVLYLSRYIIHNKRDYYKYLQGIREHNSWEPWILFMIDSVEKTSFQSIELIKAIRDLMQSYKIQIRSNYKFYSHELLNNLFKHPYTKIEFVEEELGVSRITAANYLNALAKDGLLLKAKLGKSNYYINESLVSLLVLPNP
ncbi:MAG: Fic/DOC family N-terminal domain-containing protein [Bacteroidota bacterium]